MKIRIKGNSIRLRLTKTEVERIAATGLLEEQTIFSKSIFSYSLQSIKNSGELSADFQNGKITVYIPALFIKEWATNETVGIDARVNTVRNEILYILVEKDFKCIDETTEDQSDNYDNPQAACHE